MKKKISLIIPAHSSNIFIEDILINILNWSMKPSEIIIVNSSKNKYLIKFDLIKKFKKNKIKLIIINNKNLFPGAARNIGILKSSHEYITFLDINTLPYDPNWLQINFKYLLKKNLDGLLGKTFYLTNKYKENIIVSSTYGKQYLKTVPGSLVKKKILKSIGKFNTDARAGEDTDWLERVKKSKYNFQISKAPIYYKGLYNTSFYEIIQKWFRNYYTSKNLPHLKNQKNFYLVVLFVICFFVVFNWNYSFLCIASPYCFPESSSFFIPHITKIFLLISLILYISARGIYLPIKKKIPFNFIFPINFIPITIFSFVLDFVKLMTFVSIFFEKILKKLK